MTVKKPSFASYPTGFPSVSKEGLSGEIDYGVSRSTEDGFPSQVRYGGVNNVSIQAQFKMTVSEFIQWSAWVDANAIDHWIRMPLPAPYGAATGEPVPMSYQTVRFMDYSSSTIGPNYIVVSTLIEIMPRDIGQGLPGDGGDIVAPSDPTLSDWVIAQNPNDPSPEWVIAGIPATPNTDYVIAGSP